MTSAASYLSEDVDCAHTLAVFWALRAAALQSQVSVGKVVSSTDYVLTPGWNIHTAGCYPQQTFPLSAAVGLHLRAMSLSNTLIIHAWLSDARQPPRTLRIRYVYNTPRCNDELRSEVGTREPSSPCLANRVLYSYMCLKHWISCKHNRLYSPSRPLSQVCEHSPTSGG